MVAAAAAANRAYRNYVAAAAVLTATATTTSTANGDGAGGDAGATAAVAGTAVPPNRVVAAENPRRGERPPAASFPRTCARYVNLASDTLSRLRPSANRRANSPLPCLAETSVESPRPPWRGRLPL